MIVFDLPYARVSAAFGFLLWAAIAAMYGIAVFHYLRDDIEEKRELDNLMASIPNTNPEAKQLAYMLHLEEEFEVVAQCAFGLHIAVGLLVGLQAALFGEPYRPGVLSVTRPVGFLLQVFIIACALAVTSFFVVSGVAIFTVNREVGWLILGAAFASFVADATMITLWQCMIWQPYFNGKLTLSDNIGI